VIFCLHFPDQSQQQQNKIHACICKYRLMNIYYTHVYISVFFPLLRRVTKTCVECVCVCVCVCVFDRWYRVQSPHLIFRLHTHRRTLSLSLSLTHTHTYIDIYHIIQNYMYTRVSPLERPVKPQDLIQKKLENKKRFGSE
jgi:hypothetical protein